MALYATITLTRGDTSIVLPAPRPGYTKTYRRSQGQAQTAAGNFFVYDKSVNNSFMSMTLEISEAQKEELEDFFLSTIVAGKYTFTLIDHKNETYSSVRIMQDSLDFQRTQSARYSVTLEMDLSATDAVADGDSGDGVTQYQPLDATLTSFSSLGTAADKIAYTTGVDTWAEAALTAFARSLLDDDDAATALSTLGLSTNLADLTDAEAAQLENIDATTIIADQWGYLGALDQGLASGDSPTHASLTLNNNLNLTGTGLTSGVLINAADWDTGNGSSVLGQFFLKPNITTSGSYSLYCFDSRILPVVASGITQSGGAQAFIAQVHRNQASDLGTLGNGLTFPVAGLNSFVGHGPSVGATAVTDVAIGVKIDMRHQAATINTSYGLYMSEATGGTVTAKWGIYNAINAANYLLGNTLIGTTSDDGVNKLQVNGSGKLTGALEVDGAMNHDGTTAGFYGATPTTQAAHISDANTSHATADFAEVNTALDALGTKINSILTVLENIGLVASS